MSNTIYIVGSGIHACKVFHYANQLGYKVAAFVDENENAISRIASIPVILPHTLPEPTSRDYLFVAIGNGHVRKRIMDQFTNQGWTIPSLIHPSAYVAPDVQLGPGTLVAAGAIIETLSVVGRGAIIDIGVTVDHECQIQDFSHIKPGTTVAARSTVFSI